LNPKTIRTNFLKKINVILYIIVTSNNEYTGWACGSDANFRKIWMTTNGGISFNLQYSEPGGNLNHIFFLKEKVNGEYIGWSAAAPVLYRTTNTRQTWNMIYNSLSSFCGSIQDIYFKDSLNGVIARGSQCISVTTNGGYNWSEIDEQNVVAGSRISMGSKDIGWITLGTDSILKTVNFFQTYTKQTIPSLAGSVFAIDTLIVYGALNMTNVIKTTNGGVTFIGNISGNVSESFLLKQNYPNPFNSITNIEFSIPKISYVNLTVYDVLGKLVLSAIKNELLNPRRYNLSIDFTGYTSGLYFYKIIITNKDGLFQKLKKMVFIK
jgi:hypothetical protein